MSGGGGGGGRVSSPSRQTDIKLTAKHIKSGECEMRPRRKVESCNECVDGVPVFIRTKMSAHVGSYKHPPVESRLLVVGVRFCGANQVLV